MACGSSGVFLKKNIFFLLVSLVFFACKSIPNFESYESDDTTELLVPKEEEASTKDKTIMTNIEVASYNSLRHVLQIVLAKPASLDSNDKLYLYLASNLLKILYPYTNITWYPPHFSKENSYVEGFDAFNKNEYLYRLPKDDFLSCILPVFLILKKDFPKMFMDDAMLRLERAKEFNKNSPLPYYLEALFFESSYNNQKAKESYQKAIELDKSFYPAIIKYAALCNALSQTDEAIKILQDLPEEYHESEEVLLLKARISANKKEVQEIKLYMDKLSEKKVDKGDALFDRVRLLIETGEYMKANSLLNIYTVQNKTDKTYLLLKARIAKEWNKNDKLASGYLAQAYSYYPDDFLVLIECATLALDANIEIQGQNADQLIEKVLKLRNDNIESTTLLLKRELKYENWDHAVSLALALVKQNPSNTNKTFLIRAYLGNLQYDLAFSIASSLYQNNEQLSDEVFFYYLETLYYTGKTNILKNIINENIEDARGERKSMLYYYNAKLQGKRSSAYLTLLRSALLTYPRNQIALFSMYEWYFEQKDYRDAQFYLKQAIGVEGGANKKYIELYDRLNLLLDSSQLKLE